VTGTTIVFTFSPETTIRVGCVSVVTGTTTVSGRLVDESGVVDILSVKVTDVAETKTCFEVFVLRVLDSEVFGDSAKTVEVGSRIPKEIISEFQRSFIGKFG
jgi:hypothetical protein